MKGFNGIENHIISPYFLHPMLVILALSDFVRCFFSLLKCTLLRSLNVCLNGNQKFWCTGGITSVQVSEHVLTGMVHLYFFKCT